MERIPRAMRGRVFSLLGSLAWVLIPFGGLLGGALVTTWGLTAALLVVAAAYFLATTLPALRPEWKQMDDREADGAAEPVLTKVS